MIETENAGDLAGGLILLCSWVTGRDDDVGEQLCELSHQQVTSHTHCADLNVSAVLLRIMAETLVKSEKK